MTIKLLSFYFGVCKVYKNILTENKKLFVKFGQRKHIPRTATFPATHVLTMCNIESDLGLSFNNIISNFDNNLSAETNYWPIAINCNMVTLTKDIHAKCFASVHFCQSHLISVSNA